MSGFADIIGIDLLLRRIKALEEKAAHFQKIEADLPERIASVERNRLAGEDSMFGMLLENINALYEEMAALDNRLTDCEQLVSADNAIQPQPDIGTIWHSAVIELPEDDSWVEVLTSSDLCRYGFGSDFDFSVLAHDYIVAWRYVSVDNA